MRILVVDDELLNRFLLIHMLEEAGYADCYEAETGREALQLAQKIKPDLVLLDVFLPDMEGYDLAPMLKKMAGDIYLPVIFITALDDQNALARCLEVGGDDFASKPFDKIILTAKIRAHSRTRSLSEKASQQNTELNYFRNGVEREHAIVEHIFANALTINKRAEPFFDYRLAPASSFNGDLFLSEPSPSGGIYFLMGDFTGHGLASAIGALPVARAFQAMAGKGISISEMAATINKTLLTLLPTDMFFAAVLTEISSSGCQLTVWNGGMPDLSVFSPEGLITKKFASLHMALGILEPHEFEDKVEYHEAQMGDRLVGYSDGIIELINSDEQMLGEDAVLNWLSDCPSMAVSEVSHRVEKFRGNAMQLDDITFVTYTCQSLDALKPEYTVTQLPFNIEVSLDAERLQHFDPVHELVIMVSSQLGMQGVRSDLSTALGELFNNALDHGLLKLDSSLKKTTEGFFKYYESRIERLETLKDGQICIKVAYQPATQTLQVCVEDTGPGFDYNLIKDSNDTDAFGRGIPLVRELCQSVEYSNNGTRVDVTFEV